MTLDHDLTAGNLAKVTPAPLSTARLTLRGPTLDDVDAVAALAADIRVAENTALIPHPYRVEDARAWIAAANTEPGDESYVMTLDGTAIGACGLHHRREDYPPEIGYWLGVPFWNQGYASEAVTALIDRAFDDLNHDLLVAGARVTNVASRRILEKCGFRWTDVGLYRIRSLASSVPVDRFRLERAAWAALKQQREPG